MRSVEFKLKQASAVLGVTPKELQNFVQFGVLRPRKRGDVYWFDLNLLLQAKVAFFVKASLHSSVDYLARLTKELSRSDLKNAGWKSVTLSCTAERGKSPVEIRIPFGELQAELEEALHLAAETPDLVRGRKRKGWANEFIEALHEAGKDMGAISEKEIAETVRAVRTKKKKLPEITVVAPVPKSA